MRALGHPVTVVDPGDWGRLMNGGAWWTVDGVKVDVLYRDLDAVAHWTQQAQRGRFDVDDLLGYLAGFPTYAVVGELALGQLLTPRTAAAPRVSGRAEADRAAELALARGVPPSVRPAAHGAPAHGARRPPGGAARLTRADLDDAHARLAEGGEWVLNENSLLARAGLPTT